MTSPPRQFAAVVSAVVSLAVLAGLAACSPTKSAVSAKSAVSNGATPASSGATTVAPLPAAQLSLVAYSTPQAAYDKIIKAFQATAEGKNITFAESFGASGDQSRAVEAGLSADVVAFSLAPDMTKL